MPEPFQTPAEGHEYMRLMIRMFEERMAEETKRLVDGEIRLLDWQITMREDLRKLSAFQVIAGANGEKSNVSADDWLKLGPQLRSQYGYLSDFAHAIYNGQLSAAMIEARVVLYARATQVVYWQRFTRDLDLPTQPGMQICGPNCGCGWDIVYDYDGDGNVVAAYCYWKRGKRDSCPDCVNNERQYNPYHVVLEAA
jgi:hypothetical protein